MLGTGWGGANNVPLRLHAHLPLRSCLRTVPKIRSTLFFLYQGARPMFAFIWKRLLSLFVLFAIALLAETCQETGRVNKAGSVMAQMLGLKNHHCARYFSNLPQVWTRSESKRSKTKTYTPKIRHVDAPSRRPKRKEKQFAEQAENSGSLALPFVINSVEVNYPISSVGSPGVAS